MRRALTATLTALALTAAGAVAASTAQAGRWAPVATFTLDANGTTLPATQVAADWSKGTNVLVRAGSCSGARCIKLTDSDMTRCASFTSGFGTAFLGCGGFTLADGSCGVDVASFLKDYPDARRYTTAHEVGHCLRVPHLADPRALMYPTATLAPRIVAPTKTDKAALNSLYPR